jgi:hypothetical protein
MGACRRDGATEFSFFFFFFFFIVVSHTQRHE